MFRIDTDRLTIRPWEAGDHAAFHRLMADPDVTRYLNRGMPWTDDEIEAWFVRQARYLRELDFCMGAVIEKTSGRFIGISGLQPLGTTSELEIGWIFERPSWGRGYATEAGGAAMRYVLGTLGREKVVAIIDPENDPSKRVAARLGMQYDRRYTGAELGHRKPEIVVDLYFRERDSESAPR